MHRFGSTLVILLGLVLSTQALAAGASGSFGVSVVVLPSQADRVQAIAPVDGFQRMETKQGEHWVVEKSAKQATLDYQGQLAAAGYQAVDSSGLQWKKGDLVVVISVQEAMSSRPISRLSLLTYRARPTLITPLVASLDGALALVN